MDAYDNIVDLTAIGQKACYISAFHDLCDFFRVHMKNYEGEFDLSFCNEDSSIFDGIFKTLDIKIGEMGYITNGKSVSISPVSFATMIFLAVHDECEEQVCDALWHSFIDDDFSFLANVLGKYRK